MPIDMELISYSNTRPDFSRQSDDVASLEIRAKYGGTLSMLSKFSVDNQEYCATNIEKALRSGAPAMVMLGKAYGEEAIQGLLAVHITSVAFFLGVDEKISEYETHNIAKAIWMHPMARLLSIPSVIAFFFYARLGYFKFYSCHVKDFVEAFTEYATKAVETERNIRAKIEKEKARKEMEDWRSKAIPYEQSEHYKRTHENNPLT